MIGSGFSPIFQGQRLQCPAHQLQLIFNSGRPVQINYFFFLMVTSGEDFKLIVLAVPGVVQVCFTALQSTDNIFVEKFVDITLLLFRSHLGSWTDWIVRRPKVRTRNKKKHQYLKHFIVICELFIKKKRTSFSINIDVYLHSIIY